MPAELVEEFPEGHKEAAERHEDSEDSPDWTEPGIIPFLVQHRAFQGVAKCDGYAAPRVNKQPDGRTGGTPGPVRAVIGRT